VELILVLSLFLPYLASLASSFFLPPFSLFLLHFPYFHCVIFVIIVGSTLVCYETVLRSFDYDVLHPLTQEIVCHSPALKP